jgi:hypothetical protein
MRLLAGSGRDQIFFVQLIPKYILGVRLRCVGQHFQKPMRLDYSNRLSLPRNTLAGCSWRTYSAMNTSGIRDVEWKFKELNQAESASPATVSTLSTFSTSTPSTPGGLLSKIQRLTVPHVWLGPCPYPTRNEKVVFKLGSPFATT